MVDRLKFRFWDSNQKRYNEAYFSYDVSYWEYLQRIGVVVEQCTGLKDKTGNLIYEGDFVVTKQGDVAKVVYSEHFLRWQLVFVKGSGHLLSYKSFGLHIFDWVYPDIKIEVIGNIHENKDLLNE